MAKQTKHQKWLKKLGLKEYVIHMGTFDFNILCVIGGEDNLEEYIAFKYDEPDFNLSESSNGYEPRGKCFHCVGYEPIIWLPKKPETPREIATLAHECLHAAKHMMRWAGIPFSDETEELETHAMGHLITEILNANPGRMHSASRHKTPTR